jgi:hypothetical protein
MLLAGVVTHNHRIGSWLERTWTTISIF